MSLHMIQTIGDVGVHLYDSGVFQFDSFGWTDSGFSLDGATGISLTALSL